MKEPNDIGAKQQLMDKKITNSSNNLKSNEKKLGPSSTSRLPSFRAPRDLSLSSNSVMKPLVNRSRKTFAPNIPIKREKSEKASEIKNEKPSSNRKKNESAKRGRGREKEYVQTTGTLFGEGIAAPLFKRGSGGHYGSGGKGGGKMNDTLMQKPALNLAAPMNIDLEHEKQTLKDLLRDDFIDDPEDVTPDILPVQLPMVNSLKGFMKKKREHFYTKGETSLDNMDVDSSPIDIQVKTEPPDELEMCSSMKNIKVNVPTQEEEVDTEESVSHILTQTQDLLFIKLPSCLPCHPSEIREEMPTGTSAKNIAQINADKSEDPKRGLCTLETLPEGRIGTVRIYKSGKTELTLGDHKLLVDKGTQQGFLQDAVSITADPEKRQGNLTVLGHIQHRLVCTPDFETIIRKTTL